MRPTVMLLMALAATCWLAGCTALVMGGGSPGTTGGVGSSQPADGPLGAAVRERLAADALLSGYALGVTASGGRVTLTGQVPSYAARQRAASIAGSVDGVVAVSNRITVAR